MRHNQILVKDGPSEEYDRGDLLPSSTANYPSFHHIGGLQDNIQALREMVIIPLLYPQIFARYKISPVRGVLFYGPPGTGKTLVAGALARECSKLNRQKVAFFHRKAADVLVKWVGESEQKLRDLFSKACELQPSIIFFDELDGLAPVRSSTQDHIHSSIVTTLLALMDGLDTTRGVIVIGATNRLNAIDPALRRPGRFDRELYFPLPNRDARKQIIEVHTKSWGKNQTPNDEFLSYLASNTEGYCGSDLRALCTEAVMNCLRRTHPDVRNVANKIDINLRVMKIEENDFLQARKKTIPASHFTNSTLMKLSKVVQPLLQRQLDFIMLILRERWPHFVTPGISREDIPEDMGVSGRILLTGSPLQGHSTHMAPALLQMLEHLPVHIIDVQTIYKDSSMYAEEICIQKIEEAKNNLPAIVMIYRIDQLLKLMNNNAKEILQTVLKDIPVRLPLLILATSTDELSRELYEYFNEYNSLVIKMEDPTTQERFVFLNPLCKRAVFNVTKPVIQPVNTQGDSKMAFNELITLGKRKHTSVSSVDEGKRSGYEYKSFHSMIRNKFPSCKNLRLKKASMKSLTKEFNLNLRPSVIDKKRIHDESRMKEFTSFEDCLQHKDVYDSNDTLNYIKTLFKRAIIKTSKNMQISQLELFYDVLQNRIIRNTNNHKKLIDELEEILTCFEKMP